MKKFVALFLLILLFFTTKASLVQASDMYEINLSRELHLDGDYEYNLVNTFLINNVSPKFVITSLDYFVPLNFTNAEVTVGGKSLNMEIKGSHIIVALGENALKPLSKLELKINLFIPDLLTVRKNSEGVVLGAQFLLPKDVTKALNLYTQTKIFYDSKELIPEYLSNDVVLDGNSIQYTKNIDLFVSFTNLGGVSIDYKGDSNVAMLPNTKFNKVVYENIPGEGKLSRDAFGNNYLEDKNPVNYLVKAVPISNSEIPVSVNSIPANMKNYYFSKEELAGFDLDKDIATLYRQMLVKFNPEIEKFKVKYDKFSEIEKEATQDPLAYALTFASLLKQKEIDAQVVFGKVIFPLAAKESWHFWVVYNTDNSVIQSDPYMEDLLGFTGFKNVPPERIILAGWAPEPRIIGGINNLISGELKMDFFSDIERITEMVSGELRILNVPDSFVPKLRLEFKNLSSDNVILKGIFLNDNFVPLFNNFEMASGTQKEFDVFIGLNFWDLFTKKGVFRAKVLINNGVKDYYFYSDESKIPASAFYWFFGINLGVVLLAGVFIIIRQKRFQK
jgi:hypothetical protein